MRIGRFAGLVALVLGLTATGVGAQGGEDTDVAAVILAAGNTEDEVERHSLLAGLAGSLGPDDPLVAELDLLLPVVDQWANGREDHWVPGDQEFGEQGYLAGFFNFRAHPAEPGETIFPPEIAVESPLYPIWAMYRGRMLIQQSIQTGFIQRDPAIRAEYQDEGRALLSVAAAAFPDNRILAMWLDEPIPWPAYPAEPAAPAWANLQREALGKLADIIDFWIDERQAPDGQLGGGWGDDVEIWRRWTPVLVGFADPEVDAAQRLLAEGLWNLPRLADGYTSLISDVEHTSEDTGDTVTAMLHVDPTDSVWTTRAERLAQLMEQRWSDRNERDQLQFRSGYFTSGEVSDDPALACDTPYHTRAVQPSLLLWQRTRDPALTDLFTDWLDTWVDATARAERGKPAGVVPAAIHWPSGEAAGPEPDWWDPGCAISIDRGLYEWPSFVSEKLRSLVLAAWITGDDDYLAPLRSMAELRRDHLDGPDLDAAPGTTAWAAARMGGSLSQPLAKYRLLSGDTSFDDLLAADAGPYMTLRLTGDDAALLAALEELVAALRINEAAYTTEVRWSDRLFSFASEYANHHVDPPLPQARPDVLYNMVTGDPGDALYLPLNAVRWHTGPRDLAVLVDSHDPAGLTARLFHFGEDERAMGAELLVLEPGDYDWRVQCDSHTAGGSLRVIADQSPVVEFGLPPGVECTFEVGPELAPLETPDPESTDPPPAADPDDVAGPEDGGGADIASRDGGDGNGGAGTGLIVGILVALAVIAGGAAMVRRRVSAR